MHDNNYVEDWKVLMVFISLLIILWCVLSIFIWLCSSDNVLLGDIFSNQWYHITHLLK